MQLLAIGSLFAVEHAAQLSSATEAGGCVAEAARAAVGRGIETVAAGRVGMDRLGREIIEALKLAKANVTTVQTDSDLPTARRVQRGDAVRMEPYAAFDTLQWDSDLEAAARTCDALVTDACGRRHGQARSTIDRALISSPSAVRAIDLVARPAGQEARLDRDQVGNALELCDLFVVDTVALKTVAPASTDDADGVKRLRVLAPRACVVLFGSSGMLVGRGTTVTTIGDGDPLLRSTACCVEAALAIAGGRPIEAALLSWARASTP